MRISDWSSDVCSSDLGKVICIGLNYSDHARESNMEIPKEPIVFQKGSNTVVGPYDPLIIPRGSEKTDWEVELGVVIGKDARYLQSREERSEEHTSELKYLMRTWYAVFCLKTKCTRKTQR